MDWLDLLAVQGTLKSLLQHHSSKASILRCSPFFIVQLSHPYMFIGMTDFEAATPILWPPDAKSWLIWKDSEAGKDWGQQEKGTTEDEMVGWHHWLNGHGFGWTPGAVDGQGGLACCGSWGHKESDTIERLNWTELNWNDTALIAEVVVTHSLIIGFCYCETVF